MSTVKLPEGLTAGTWAADPSHSEAAFSVRHAGIAKVRGTVGIISAVIEIGETLKVHAELDPRTVTTRDKARDQHLLSSDFFDVESHPKWVFTSNSVTLDGADAKIVGELTIRGVTKMVTLEAEFNGVATDPFGNSRAGFSAQTEISRKDYGLTWNAALETGGVLVGDKVKVELEISAIKQ